MSLQVSLTQHGPFDVLAGVEVPRTRVELRRLGSQKGQAVGNGEKGSAWLAWLPDLSSWQSWATSCWSTATACRSVPPTLGCPLFSQNNNGQSTATGQQSPASPPVSHPIHPPSSNPHPTHHHAFAAINNKGALDTRSCFLDAPVPN